MRNNYPKLTDMRFKNDLNSLEVKDPDSISEEALLTES